MNRQNRGADKWIERYYRGKGSGGPRGVGDPVADSGIVLSRTCASCSDSHAEPTSDSGFPRKSRTGYFCSKCGNDWNVTEEVRFIGEIKVSTVASWLDAKLTKQLDLSRQFNEFVEDPLFLWEAKYYISNCMGFSIRRLVKEGPETWGEEAPDTIWKVRKAVMTGRKEWARRLKEIGISV